MTFQINAKDIISCILFVVISFTYIDLHSCATDDTSALNADASRKRTKPGEDIKGPPLKRFTANKESVDEREYDTERVEDEALHKLENWLDQ